MVKLQKPIPKKFKEKVKLDNPIKKQKVELKKGKSKSATKNISTKLLEIPIKEAQAATKLNKVTVKKSNDVKKSNKKQETLQTKPVVALKVKELKTNGSVQAKAAKKSPVSKENGSIKKPSVLVKAQVSKLAKPKSLVSNENGSIKNPPVLKLAKSKSLVSNENGSLNEPPVLVKGQVSKLSKPKPTKAAEHVEDKKETVKAVKSQKKIQNVTRAPKQLPSKRPTDSTVKETLPLKAPVALAEPSNKLSVTGKKQPKQPIAKVQKPDKKVAKLNEKKIAKIASIKAKLHPVEDEAEKKGEEDDEKKEEIKRERKIFRYDPFPYDEEKFDSIVCEENITKVVDALKILVQKEVANKKTAIFDDYRFLLQVGCFKIPSCPKRMVKLFLKHPMVDQHDDVLLVVSDLKRGGKVDYEPTKHHYEDLLRTLGLEWIKVMPMNQLRKEYTTFEQKRRLCASYDHFLCDGRIVSHVVGLIGKIAQKPRLTFHAVRMTERKDLKREIEKGLYKTAYRQLCKSTLYTIPVATHKFTSQQVAENVFNVVTQLKKIFPGGMGNVRNLYLKIDLIGTSALPFYISMAQPPEETPYVVGLREKRMLRLKQEANDVLSKFAMTKEGKLIKLTKAGVEKKRKLKEMKATLKAEEEQQPKAKKAKKSATDSKKKQKQDEVKELELPENEEDDDDDDNSDEDDENVVQLGGSSDEEESEDMGQFDQEEDDDQASLDAESDVEILENGLAEEDDETDDDEDQDDANTSGGDDDDDDDEEDDDDDDGDDDDEEEDDESD